MGYIIIFILAYIYRDKISKFFKDIEKASREQKRKQENKDEVLDSYSDKDIERLLEKSSKFYSKDDFMKFLDNTLSSHGVSDSKIRHIKDLGKRLYNREKQNSEAKNIDTSKKVSEKYSFGNTGFKSIFDDYESVIDLMERKRK